MLYCCSFVLWLFAVFFGTYMHMNMFICRSYATVLCIVGEHCTNLSTIGWRICSPEGTCANACQCIQVPLTACGRKWNVAYPFAKYVRGHTIVYLYVAMAHAALLANTGVVLTQKSWIHCTKTTYLQKNEVRRSKNHDVTSKDRQETTTPCILWCTNSAGKSCRECSA